MLLGGQGWRGKFVIISECKQCYVPEMGSYAFRVTQIMERYVLQGGTTPNNHYYEGRHAVSVENAHERTCERSPAMLSYGRLALQESGGGLACAS